MKLLTKLKEVLSRENGNLPQLAESIEFDNFV